MPCCLFCYHLTSQLDPKPFKQVVSFWFPLLRKVLDRYPIEAKKITENMPAAPIPPQNHTGLSAPFQLNSMSNSSPQSMLQSSESKKAGYLSQVLSRPFMVTLEAREGTLNQGKGVHSSKQAMYSAPWSPREIFVQALNVSIAGPGSIISQPRWPAFFNSELCSVHCGDECDSEFN